MANKKELDQLTRRALEANALGMSYGAYVAKFHPPKPKQERYPQRHRDGERKCQWCGVWFPSEQRFRKYCCQACADKAREVQKQEAYRKKKEKEERERTASNVG